MGRHGSGRFLVDVDDLPEDPDDPVALDEGNGVDLDARATAVPVDDDHRRVRDLLDPGDLSCEVLPGAARLLRRDDRRELAAARVTDETFRRAVHPADHTGGVDDVGRNADLLDRSADVAGNRVQPGPRGLLGSRRLRRGSLSPRPEPAAVPRAAYVRPSTSNRIA